MSEFNRTPVPFQSTTLPVKPTTTLAGAAPALNADGLDLRMWWNLEPFEQAERMDKHSCDWWVYYRHAVRCDAVVRACQEVTL